MAVHEEAAGIGVFEYKFYVANVDEFQAKIDKLMDLVDEEMCGPGQCDEDSCVLVGSSGRYMTLDEFDAWLDS